MIRFMNGLRDCRRAHRFASFECRVWNRQYEVGLAALKDSVPHDVYSMIRYTFCNFFYSEIHGMQRSIDSTANSHDIKMITLAQLLHMSRS